VIGRPIEAADVQDMLMVVRAMWESFSEFFRAATGGFDPYPFQQRFAEADKLPHLVRAPTGSGKTATAILGWLWRWVSQKPNTPRRLVYCLPMRVLVEQSEREANRWLSNLKLNVPVHVLMGGIEAEQWHHYPEKPAILIGTQDMLLSRALNRGYAASRFHWPIDFGLLNNDCLWVFDEPQLMGSGVSTSAQLAGLRNALGTFGPCSSVWMSATLEPGWLDTVDFRGKFPGAPLELTSEDYDPFRPLNRRMTADKTVTPLGHKITKDADDKEAKVIAAAVLAKHEAGAQTMVVLNTVRRAKAIFAALRKDKWAPATLLLVHSRFRPAERERLNEALQAKGDATKGRVIVATQVVEAGVDISARTLVTELAPWASTVQRIGRCNRTADDNPGRVYWIDLDEAKLSAPYEAEDLAHARGLLIRLEDADVSPKALDEFKTANNITLPFEHTHVLRRRDLIDLFDTTPDLSGNDIDVTRFVRGDDPETDVQVFWRTWPGDEPPPDLPAPHRRELCPVPVGKELRDFLDKRKDKRQLGFVWDYIEREWVKLDPRQLRPGMTILLPSTFGGYSDLGWDAESTAAVDPVPINETLNRPEEATGSDDNSETPVRPRTIAEHTDGVCESLDEILTALDGQPADFSSLLRTAARWHDAGKGHAVFQDTMRRVNPNLTAERLWAKTGKSGRLRHGQPHFRHELVSALAALQHGKPFEVAYLIAAHHGKVRLSIRSVPGEEPPDDEQNLFALGVHHGDRLPAVDLGGQTTCPAITLDLSPMQIGGVTSWTANALALRDRLGPFKLAYLEAILRAADERTSAAERKEDGHA
jgi:CRISPR-associated endonuclease/helicase Cas3